MLRFPFRVRPITSISTLQHRSSRSLSQCSYRCVRSGVSTTNLNHGSEIVIISKLGEVKDPSLKSEKKNLNVEWDSRPIIVCRDVKHFESHRQGEVVL